MKTQLLLASRYLWGRRQRTILTSLAVVLSVAILFGLNGLFPPMIEAFRHNMIISAGKVDITLSGANNGTFDQSVLPTAASVDGVSQLTGSLVKTVLLPESMGGTTNQLTGTSRYIVTGVDPATAVQVRNFAMASGRFLEPSDVDAVVINQKLADQRSLAPGDTLTIPSSEGTAALTVVGVLNNIAGSAEEIYVPLATAQKILDLPGQINLIEVLIRADANQPAVQQRLLTALGSGFKAGPVEVGNELLATMSLGQSMMSFIGILALAMAAFIIFNTFRTVVAERRRDLGMLRAIGANRRTILGLIVTESVIQGIIGTAFGILLGAIIAFGALQALNMVIQQFLRVSLTHPVFTPSTWAASILLGIGFTVASAYLPARSAMKVSPLEAIRPTPAATEQRIYVRRAVIGLILMVLGVVGVFAEDLNIVSFAMLIFLTGMVLLAPVLVKPIADNFGRLLGVIFKREGTIAQGNLSRQPGRAAITASAMMIGIAITIGMLGMITSVFSAFLGYLDKSLGADYLVMPSSLVLGGGNLGADPALAQKLAAVDGVSGVATLRLSSSEANGAALQVIGIDPVTYPRIAGLEFSRGEPDQAFSALGNSRSIIVNGIFATSGRVKVGDVLTLKTAVGDQQYKVVGIAMDYLNAKLATGYISQANMTADFHATSDVLLMADRASGANTAAVTAAVRSLVGQYPSFSLVDAASFKKTQQDLFMQVMVIFYVLILALAVPGLIAMTNTMSINVIERTREIGMLRAVGSTQKQIRRMVLAESLLLSALGTVMGIAVGLFLSYYMVKALSLSGFVLKFYFPGIGILAAIAVGLIFGILAALAPARKAASTQIVDALHYE